MENNENREFYVYAHIRLDNNTCFYIGKGKGDRKDIPTRNTHHDRISERYGHKVVVIKNNLTEKDAFELEREIIEDYVFTFGYGIDIEGYRDYSNNKYLTNCTWGGEGTSGMHHSEETKQMMSESNKGKNNPFYGKHHSKETMDIIKEKTGKKVMCVETGQIFISVSECSKEMQCDRRGIQKVCVGKQKHCGGYTFKFVD